jgi:hypothetical protein
MHSVDKPQRFSAARGRKHMYTLLPLAFEEFIMWEYKHTQHCLIEISFNSDKKGALNL